MTDAGSRWWLKSPKSPIRAGGCYGGIPPFFLATETLNFPGFLSIVGGIKPPNTPVSGLGRAT